jgi:hypothetical protein
MKEKKSFLFKGKDMDRSKPYIYIELHVSSHA